MGHPGTGTARPGNGRPAEPVAEARTEAMPVIGGLDELATIVSEHGEAYLRHSFGPGPDAHQRSRDYESGLELPGLSAVPLTPPAWWSRPAHDWLARQICKYAHLTERDSRRFPWILTGKVTGAGPDSEPLIADPQPLGRLGAHTLTEARQRYHERFDVGRYSRD
jgi:hypothetical protein